MILEHNFLKYIYNILDKRVFWYWIYSKIFLDLGLYLKNKIQCQYSIFYISTSQDSKLIIQVIPEKSPQSRQSLRAGIISSVRSQRNVIRASPGINDDSNSYIAAAIVAAWHKADRWWIREELEGRDVALSLSLAPRGNDKYTQEQLYIGFELLCGAEVSRKLCMRVCACMCHILKRFWEDFLSSCSFLLTFWGLIKETWDANG